MSDKDLEDQTFFFGGMSMSYQTAVLNGYIDPDKKVVTFGGLLEPPDFSIDEKDPEAVVRGKENRNLGEITEGLVKRKLEQLGFVMIRKVQNVWRIVKFVEKKRDGKVLAIVIPVKIEGDYRAVDPLTGKSVLVEVKARGERLNHSALEDHQISELDAHANANGISILAWVDTNSPNWEIYIMRWPIIDDEFEFKKYKSIAPEIAKRFTIE